jgi:hypothetical protein
MQAIAAILQSIIDDPDAVARANVKAHNMGTSMMNRCSTCIAMILQKHGFDALCHATGKFEFKRAALGGAAACIPGSKHSIEECYKMEACAPIARVLACMQAAE